MRPTRVRAHIEQALTSAWYSGAWWLYLLWPLSLIVRLVVYQRRRAFLRHPPDPSATPVVVVGGITVGGTGKTPVIIALIEALTQRGLRVGVVSRGYGGVAASEPTKVNENADHRAVGDEPVLIARKTHCPMVVCQRRPAALAVLDKEDLDLILSDDGLQHYAMARAFEIAVLDADRGVGNGQLIPMGPLRESATRLATVDWVLYRSGTDTASAVNYKLVGFRHLHNGDFVDLANAQSRWQGGPSPQLAFVAAIGQPQQFFQMLHDHGFDGETLGFADHQSLSQSDLDMIKADIIITTEKDAVKMTAIMDQRVWVLEIAAQLPEALIETLMMKFAQESA